MTSNGTTHTAHDPAEVNKLDGQDFGNKPEPTRLGERQVEDEDGAEDFLVRHVIDESM